MDADMTSIARWTRHLLVAPLLIVASLAAGVAEAVPQIQSWTATSGAKVLFVEAPDLPILDVEVVFDAGSARDGEKKGLASMTASLMTQGAGDFDADALAERIESVGASVSVSASRDLAQASMRTLTEPEAMETAVSSLVQVLSVPRFAEPDFERTQQNQLLGLRQEKQDPGSLGNRALMSAIYGDHPYASDPEGTEETVAKLERDDLVRFHRTYYTAANATLAIVGALDRAQAEALAERLTIALPPGGKPEPIPPVPTAQTASELDIAFPSSQTHLYLGQPGSRRGDPDYFTLYVGNHVLGGSGLTSLLMQEVREKRGLSYSVYSYFSPLRQLGPFVLGLQTKNSQAHEALAVVKDTLRRYVEQGPSEDELQAAIKNITGGFPLRIASNKMIVKYLAVIGFYDLPLDYLERFQERIASVTVEQVSDAFARRLHPDALKLVRVGQPGPAAEQAAAVDAQ